MATIETNTRMSRAEALWTLFQHQPSSVRKAFVQKLEEDAETKRQKKLVKESLTRALNEVKLAEEGKLQLKDAKDLFK